MQLKISVSLIAFFNTCNQKSWIDSYCIMFDMIPSQSLGFCLQGHKDLEFTPFLLTCVDLVNPGWPWSRTKRRYTVCCYCYKGESCRSPARNCMHTVFLVFEGSHARGRRQSVCSGFRHHEIVSLSVLPSNPCLISALNATIVLALSAAEVSNLSW
jgi:hypothetical protein